MKKLLFVFLALSMILSSHTKIAAQTFDSCDVAKSYLEGDMLQWEQLVEKYEDADLTSMSENELYTLLTIEYGLVGYNLNLDNSDKAEEYLDMAYDHVEELLDAKPEEANYLAMFGALCGLEISISGYKAMFLGPRSMEHVDKALANNPGEPMSWIEKGNAMFNAPEMFGGSKSEGIKNYKQGIVLFEALDQTKCNWLYFHSLAILGSYYQTVGDEELAIEQYNKVLAIAPNYRWVKEELKPAVE